MAMEELPCRWRERTLAFALRSVLLGVEDELGLRCKRCVVLWVSSTSVSDELYYHGCVLSIRLLLLGTDLALCVRHHWVLRLVLGNTAVIFCN